VKTGQAARRKAAPARPAAPPIARRSSTKTAFARLQFALAVEDLRRQSVPLDVLPVSRIIGRCRDWMKLNGMAENEVPSWSSGKRHLPDILGRVSRGR
jgi:hypothetical protein